MAKTKSKPSRKPVRKNNAPPPRQLPQYPALPLPPVISRTLSGVAARQLSVNWTECVFLLLAALPGLWLLQATADWFFNLPWIVRFFLLMFDLAVVGYILWRYGYKPWRDRLNQHTAALQVERELPAFRSSLISAVQLSKDRSGVPGGSTELVEKLIQSVAVKLRGLKVAKHVVKTKRLMRYGKIMGAVLLLVLGVVVLAGSKTPVLIQRILLAQVPLPKQTIVIPITKHDFIAIGSDVTLSAQASGVIPKNGMIEVVYDNGERQNVSVSPTGEDDRVFSVTLRNVHQPFYYQFLLNDGVGERYRIDAKTPPVLATIDALQVYPAYTGLEQQKMQMGNLELLSGSELQIKGVSTQPLAKARVIMEGEANLNPVELKISGDGKQVTGAFRVPKEGLDGIAIELENKDGVASQENTLYRVRVVPDEVPQIELLAPAAELMSIVPEVKPTLVYTVRDDFKLSKVSLKYEVVLPTDTGAPAEGEDTQQNVGTIQLPRPESSSAGQPQRYVWDLSKISPTPVTGSTVRYWIEAEDFNNVTGPGVGQSVVKSFSIISQEAKQAELIEKLGDIAEKLEDVYNKQKKASETLDGAIRQNQP